MTFYGQPPAVKPAQRIHTFHFRVEHNGKYELKEVKAHHVFFYESGHVGFWNDLPDGDRTLVLACKVLDVWEDE